MGRRDAEAVSVHRDSEAQVRPEGQGRVGRPKGAVAAVGLLQQGREGLPVQLAKGKHITV